MKELAGRLAAVDPDAGAAVAVIAYFDRLAEARAGLEALVRGAAVLAGCAARLADEERRVRLRVEPDGRRKDSEGAPEPGWPCAPLVPGGPPALWLERAGDAGPSVVDAVILERASAAVRSVLDRTRGRAPAPPVDDPALVETVLDADAPLPARLYAARRLGLDTTDPAARFRAVAVADGPPRILTDGLPRTETDGPPRGVADGPHGLVADAAQQIVGGSPQQIVGGGPRGIAADGRPAPSAERAGVGPAVAVADLPDSWAAARTALRFSSDGGAQEPGGRPVVHSDDLGGVALLAGLVVPGAEPAPDVRAVEAAAADAPWMLRTLHAVASTASLRAAAVEVNVHHSTLQDRLTHAEHLLGWPVRTPQGRFRLQLALTMRQLMRNRSTDQ
ncbi:helix-turn-helix domain-containing protein [Streptomyces sasae]|uniref:helix-turn-helix domain-containing protein n=1 Tax=Streptomyces sasae TaxID=1266772 RepID=UPI00292FB1FD|nr:helix-turn-helix domain-containing protein [Streptomyces sasae]